MQTIVSISVTWLALSAIGQAQVPVINEPIVEDCGFNGLVACVNRYAAVLPYHFNRSITSLAADYDFRDTNVSSDASFGLLNEARFAVFDKERGLGYLGSNPSWEFMFKVGNSVHEAPVYDPHSNLLYMSELPPVGGDPLDYVSQLVVNLNRNPPTIERFTPTPPVVAPNGGTFHNRQIIWSASASFDTGNGTHQRISLHTIDPSTNKSTALLNNYFGFYFNNLDDVVVHPSSGEIFFTDPYYPWFNGRSDTAPQLPTASYRFNPKTGAVVVIDDTLEQPNGIAFDAAGETLYITETGALTGSIDPAVGPGTKHYNTTGKRSIYAFDVTNNGTKIANKRSFYLAQDYIPDGLKVSREGLVLTAGGKGLDVIDDTGKLLIRVQANHSVSNFAFTGPELKTVWLLGANGISRVQWNITGQVLE